MHLALFVGIALLKIWYREQISFEALYSPRPNHNIAKPCDHGLVYFVLKVIPRDSFFAAVMQL